MRLWRSSRQQRPAHHALEGYALAFPESTWLPGAAGAPPYSHTVFELLASLGGAYAWKDGQLWCLVSGDWDTRYELDESRMWSVWRNGQLAKNTADKWAGAIGSWTTIEALEVRGMAIDIRKMICPSGPRLIETWYPGGRQYIEAHGLTHVNEMNAASLARFHVTEGPYLDHGVQPLAYLDGKLVAAGPPATPDFLAYMDLDADYVLDALAQPEGDGRLYVPLDLSL